VSRGTKRLLNATVRETEVHDSETAGHRGGNETKMLSRVTNKFPNPKRTVAAQRWR
jgi:hypothetical protein